MALPRCADIKAAVDGLLAEEEFHVNHLSFCSFNHVPAKLRQLGVPLP
jgi:hypothetical protein